MEVNKNAVFIQDGKWHMSGSKMVTSIDEILTLHPKITIIWKYNNGEWEAYSIDTDVQQSLDDANITRINSINSNEGIMYK